MANNDSNTQFNIVTVAVVYNEKNELLIVKRSVHEAHAPNIYSYPGGNVEIGTDKMDILENNLIREIKEEVNVVIDSIEYLHSHVFKKEDNTNVVVVAYIARYVSGDITKFQEKEVVKVEWINIDKVQKLDTLDIIKQVYELAYKKITNRKKLHHLTVAGIVLNDKNEFLLLKYKNNDKFGLPKGDVYSSNGNVWEVLEQNLISEIFVQTGLKIADGPIPFTDEVFVGGDHFDNIMQFFICKLESGELVKNTTLITDARWIKFEDFDTNEIKKLEYLVYQKANNFLKKITQ